MEMMEKNLKGIACKETWVVGLAMVVPEFQYMVSGYTFALQYGTFYPRPHKFGPHAQDILGTLKDEMKHEKFSCNRG